MEIVGGNNRIGISDVMKGENGCFFKKIKKRRIIKGIEDLDIGRRCEENGVIRRNGVVNGEEGKI